MSKYEYKVVGSFWLYNVYELAFDPVKLPADVKQNMIELEPAIARSTWFSTFDLIKRKTINIKVEQWLFQFVKDSFNIDPATELKPRDKFTYHITPEDEANCVKFAQLILIDYIDKHIASLSSADKNRYLNKLNNLKKRISDCKTNYDYLVIMHEHFNFPLIVVDENKNGMAVEGAQWNLSVPGGKTKPKYVTPEMLDPGPTIDNISPDVFKLDWVIGEEVVVTE